MASVFAGADEGETLARKTPPEANREGLGKSTPSAARGKRREELLYCPKSIRRVFFGPHSICGTLGARRGRVVIADDSAAESGD